MKTVIRSSYTPKLEDYCNTLVIDRETDNKYLFDVDGVWTLLSTDEEGIIEEAVAQANAYTDDVAEDKVDKEEGKGLSENDFTDANKNKLDGIEAGAQENVIEVVKRNGAALPIVGKAVDISVPTLNDATLTIQKNGTTVSTFTANASSNVTANISVPTQTSDLNNDSGFLTSSTAVTSFNGSTGDVTYTAPVTSVNGATGDVIGLQATGNLVTSVSSSSTDTQYPSAKLFYDTIGNVEAILQTLNNGGGAQ